VKVEKVCLPSARFECGRGQKIEEHETSGREKGTDLRDPFGRDKSACFDHTETCLFKSFDQL